MRATILALLIPISVASSIADARPRARVAQEPDRDQQDKDDDDEKPASEASAILPIKLDDLIEVVVRLAPDASRAKIDRQVAKNLAEGERRNQAWRLTARGEYSVNATSESVEVAPFTIVRTDK